MREWSNTGRACAARNGRPGEASAMRTALRRVRHRLTDVVAWTPPTSTEIGTVAKSGLAAGLAWWIAGAVTDVPSPVLAPLTALVVVQVSVRASIRTALERSAAVVIGVLVALAIGDALDLNGFTVAVLVGVSLGLAQLVLRLPRAAARQVPISMLVVLAAVGVGQESSGWHRAADTLIGAAIGVLVSSVLPASRLVDARQTLDRLADKLGEVLEQMGDGLQRPWSAKQTEDWRRAARGVRERMVDEAVEAAGQGREAARWNLRDRRHAETLGRYEDVMPRLERAAIGVSVISRGLDDHARLSGTAHPAMPAMGVLLAALAQAIRALERDVVDGGRASDLGPALDEVHVRRQRCVQGAARRARLALERETEPDIEGLEGEWLNYAAVLVQVDRIVADLRDPLPT